MVPIVRTTLLGGGGLYIGVPHLCKLPYTMPCTHMGLCRNRVFAEFVQVSVGCLVLRTNVLFYGSPLNPKP